MKEYRSKNIINVALVGHGSSGKTSLSESMALASGTVRSAGNIQAGSTVSDYRKQEIERQHSISMSLLNFELLDMGDCYDWSWTSDAGCSCSTWIDGRLKHFEFQ